MDFHQNRRTTMVLTRQTMTDQRRKSVALEHLKAFYKAGVTSNGGNILFAEDVP
jgi:nitrate reductase assembly molybdenum cofactor insertion protein NarJ